MRRDDAPCGLGWFGLDWCSAVVSRVGAEARRSPPKPAEARRSPPKKSPRRREGAAPRDDGGNATGGFMTVARRRLERDGFMPVSRRVSWRNTPPSRRRRREVRRNEHRAARDRITLADGFMTVPRRFHDGTHRRRADGRRARSRSPPASHQTTTHARNAPNDEPQAKESQTCPPPLARPPHARARPCRRRRLRRREWRFFPPSLETKGPTKRSEEKRREVKRSEEKRSEAKRSGAKRREAKRR